MFGNVRFCDPPQTKHYSRKEDGFVRYDKYFKIDGRGLKDLITSEILKN